MGSNIVWVIIMAPVSALFTGLGLYARKLKKPMWFYSGIPVKESEISDIPAYNRECGTMWILFSLPFWASTLLGLFGIKAAPIVMIAGCAIGIPFLVTTYMKIYSKYKIK